MAKAKHDAKAVATANASREWWIWSPIEMEPIQLTVTRNTVGLYLWATKPGETGALRYEKGRLFFSRESALTTVAQGLRENLERSHEQMKSVMRQISRFAEKYPTVDMGVPPIAPEDPR